MMAFENSVMVSTAGQFLNINLKYLFVWNIFLNLIVYEIADNDHRKFRKKKRSLFNLVYFAGNNNNIWIFQQLELSLISVNCTTFQSFNNAI